MSVAAPQDWRTIPAGDPQALRAAAGTLAAAVAAMDRVAANLGAAAEAASGGWVGPASDAFRGQVGETGAAVRTGSGAFHDAATALRRLAWELEAAQEQARRAQATLDTASGAMGSASRALALLAAAGEPDPLARSRLQQTIDDAGAELAGAQAAMAEAVERAHVAGRSAAAALQAATEAATPPQRPQRAGDPAAAAWWAGLTPVQRAWLLANDPALLGGLAGLPPAVRDRANRRRLTAEQARLQRERAAVTAELARHRAGSNLLDRLTPGWNQQEDALLTRLATLDRQLAQAAGLQAALAGVAADPRNRLDPTDVYLLSYDPPGDGRAVVALGDPTRAAAIGVVVPGMGNTLANIANPLDDAVKLRRTSDDVAGRAVTDRSVSVVAWLGYDSPDGAQAGFDDKARAGAPELVRFVEDLRDAHTGARPPRVTVLAHSYGTLVSGLAARQGLAADAVTLVGSPGVGAQHVTELGLPAERVFTARTPDDPIRGVFQTDPAAREAAEQLSRFGPVSVRVTGDVYRFGPDPSLPAFGAQPIPLDARQHGHSEYYELNTTGIRALTRIMLGRVDWLPQQAPR